MALRAQVLGTVRFTADGAEVKPRSRKGTALLAYLCLREEGARRLDLAELLWGPGRLANLRQELYALRQLPGSDKWLQDGETVNVVARTDLGDLDDLGPDDTALLLEGQFLPGLGRVDAPAFIDWLELERGRVGGLLSRKRRVVAERLESEGRYTEALTVIGGALAHEPLDERLVRISMRCAAATGDTEAAIERFEAFREALRLDLGLEPSGETRELYERIGHGEPLQVKTDVKRLDPQLKGLAQVLAVSDGGLDVETLARVVAREPLDVATDLGRLERGGWVDEKLAMPDRAAIEVLSATPPVVLRLLHLRVARALGEATDRRPEAIARHLLEADRATDAAPILLEAGEVAIAGGNPADAVPHLLRASWSAWEAPETRLRAAMLLEGCAAQLGDDGLQQAALSEAETLAWELQTDSGLAEVRMRRSRALLREGKVGEGLENALEALEIALRLGDEQLVARARNAVGGAQFFAGDLDGAERSFGQNVNAADPTERYRARNNLGGVAGIRGRTREALGHLEKALTLGRVVGERTNIVGTLNNLAAATSDRLGDYERAVKYFKESLALGRQGGPSAHEGQVLMNLSVVYARQGELGPAWNTAVEVEDLIGESGEPRLLMLANEQKAEIANLCGDAKAAQGYLEVAAGIADEIGDARKQAALRAGAAVLCARLEPESVAAAEASMLELAESRLADVTPWLWLELALSASEPEAAVRFVDRSEATDSENVHLAAIARMARLRGGLLPGADEQTLRAAADAAAWLSDAVSPTESRFVQTPRALVFLQKWRELTTSGSDGYAHTADAVETILHDQVAGLPKRLSERRLALPQAWLSGLTDGPLTLV